MPRPHDEDAGISAQSRAALELGAGARARTGEAEEGREGLHARAEEIGGDRPRDRNDSAPFSSTALCLFRAALSVLRFELAWAQPAESRTDAALAAEAPDVPEDLDGRLLAGGERAGMDAFRSDDPREGLRGGVVRQVGRHARSHRPADDLAGPHVRRGGQVQPASMRPRVGDVGEPQPAVFSHDARGALPARAHAPSPERPEDLGRSAGPAA